MCLCVEWVRSIEAATSRRHNALIYSGLGRYVCSIQATKRKRYIRLSRMLKASEREREREREMIAIHWSLRYSKSPQVSRTLLSILTVLNNAVVWMVFSTRPLISKSTRTFINPLVTVPQASIKIGHFHVPQSF